MASVPPVASKLQTDLAKHAPRVMAHMNDDHADGLKAYARALGNPPYPEAVGASAWAYSVADYLMSHLLCAAALWALVRTGIPCFSLPHRSSTDRRIAN